MGARAEVTKAATNAANLSEELAAQLPANLTACTELLSIAVGAFVVAAAILSLAGIVYIIKSTT